MLLDVKNAPLSQLQDFLHTTQKVANKHKIKDFRIQQSLGSQLASISTFSDKLANGYTLIYSNGDVCNQTNNNMFSSEVRYICDPSIAVGKPVLIKEAGQKGSFDTAEDCHFVFEWRSIMACPQCNQEQVHTVRGQCDDGERKIQTLVNNNSYCEIHPANKKFDHSNLKEGGSTAHFKHQLIYKHEGKDS